MINELSLSFPSFWHLFMFAIGTYLQKRKLHILFSSHHPMLRLLTFVTILIFQYQIKKPVWNKFNEIGLQIQEIIFLKILNFNLKLSFHLVHFHSSCKIAGRTDKMPRNASKNKITPENVWYFPLYFYL